MEVEPGVTSGDFLSGFYLGTRQALHEKGRESLTLIVSEVSGFSVGMLIALFERAVGLYATLVNINAYHQPGVEAGKKAAGSVIALQSQIVQCLTGKKGQLFTVAQLSQSIGSDDLEMIFKICEHLCANSGPGISKIPGATPFAAGYCAS